MQEREQKRVTKVVTKAKRGRCFANTPIGPLIAKKSEQTVNEHGELR